MLTAILILLRTIGLTCRGHKAVALENLALRQQLATRRRKGASWRSQRLMDFTIGTSVAQPDGMRNVPDSLSDARDLRFWDNRHIQPHVTLTVAFLTSQSGEAIQMPKPTPDRFWRGTATVSASSKPVPPSYRFHGGLRRRTTAQAARSLRPLAPFRKVSSSLAPPDS
jgi:hypothetical protein